MGGSLAGTIAETYKLPPYLARVVAAVEEMNRRQLPCRPPTLLRLLEGPSLTAVESYCCHLRRLGIIQSTYGKNIALAALPAPGADFQIYQPDTVGPATARAMTKPENGYPGSCRQTRRCMTCRKNFESEGAHNRLCAPCRYEIKRQGADLGGDAFSLGYKTSAHGTARKQVR